jgi:hypothetical protein
MSGSSSSEQVGTYGTKGVAASTNIPGARYRPAFWSDPAGNFYLFGGRGYGTGAGLGELNDFWRWDGKNWTWLAGSDAISGAGTYGTKNVDAAGNIPGYRSGAGRGLDATGDFLLFGGSPTGTAGNQSSDLWRFKLKE